MLEQKIRLGQVYELLREKADEANISSAKVLGGLDLMGYKHFQTCTFHPLTYLTLQLTDYKQ